jgi:hypothetical protein
MKKILNEKLMDWQKNKTINFADLLDWNNK